jgi:SAM-dependent methyltransferase
MAADQVWVAAITAGNRAGWNQIAAGRDARPASFYRDGGCTLADFELALMPDLQSRTLLHLACANGSDSLSLAVRGARVTGIDISDVAVAVAERTAREAGLDARFIAADVYGLPTGLGEFDIVYMSWGGICWMPDLDRWAAIVAAHLKPGGSLALFEHHPLWEILAVRDGNPVVIGSYFGSAHPGSDPAKRMTGWTPGSDSELTSFVWPVSQVLTALQRAGLRIESFTESADSSMYPGLQPAPAWLPACYAIIAAKG